MAVIQAFYQILDVGLSLETDSDAFLNLFDRDYSWFRTPSPPSPTRLLLFVGLPPGGGEAFLRIDEEVISLEGHPNPALYAYQVLLQRLFQRVKDFLLLHAGVVAQEDRGLILAGPPGAGKSTMVSELLEWGKVYFSDDFCPIHTATHYVHPFPRSLWISPQSRLAAGVSCDSSRPDSRNNKVPVRPDQLSARVGGKPCQPKWLICLDAGEDPGRLCELRLGLKEPTADELVRDLGEMEQVRVERFDSQHSEWRITYPVGVGLTRGIKELMEKHRAAVWNVFRVDRIRPDFDKEPVLTPIPASRAAFLLMRELKQGLAPESPTSPSRRSPGALLMKLNELLLGVDCYRLTVGRLEAMRELVLALTDTDRRG